ncbi:MAG: purine-binding chemotaxis protein CheW [Deferribacteres bacterium]|nr:purine-binding chemotaxis protein CheW [candidate division KSB1 bacterium]MCB9501909.1 purine-binding chemotaxis protein CheW [Deferribacteres bacterium]
METTVSDKKSTNSAEDILQLVSFKLGEEEFGVDILAVQEIIRMIEITRVPNSPHFVEGVINLRGKVLPVVNLRKRLGLPVTEYSKSTRIIVIELDKKTVGFIVDSVSEVLRIPTAVTEPPPQMVGRVDSEYITAVGKLDDRLVILLDLNRVLSNEEKMLLV